MKNSVFLLLLLTTELFSQKMLFKGRLLDARTNAPIVYANISFLETTKGISSTEDGSFRMYVDKKHKNGKIHISCLNYKDTIVSAIDLNGKTFFMHPKHYVLEEAAVTKRVVRFFLQDKVKNKVHAVHTNGMRMLAKYFPNDRKNRHCNALSKVTIYFSKRHNKKAKFRIRIFSKDEITGLPKEDLLPVNLPLVISQQQNQVSLDIASYGIEMPKNGLFIAFEKLFIPFNAYGNRELLANKNMLYAPIIGFTKYRYKELKERTYYYAKGRWKKSEFNKVTAFRKYAPAISLTLTN